MTVAQEELLGHGEKPNDSPVGTIETERVKESMTAHTHASLFDHCVFSTQGKTARDRMRRAMHRKRNERLQTSLRDFPATAARSQDWRLGLFSRRPSGTSCRTPSHSTGLKMYKLQCTDTSALWSLYILVRWTLCITDEDTPPMGSCEGQVSPASSPVSLPHMGSCEGQVSPGFSNS